MEPLSTQTKESILSRILNSPAASPDAYTRCLSEMEEYERLLAERFATDPGLPKSFADAAAEQTREARLAELYQKYFSE